MSENLSKYVALVGPPNTGKTSIYNHLTGSRYKTVNYPGATVEYCIGKLRQPSECANMSHPANACCEIPDPMVNTEPGSIQIIDTPGIVSLIPRSQDEEVSLKALFNLDKVLKNDQKNPNLLIALLDATQPARHLPLIKQIIDCGFKVIVAVSMNDLAKKQNRNIDVEKLSNQIGTPVVEIDGRTGKGILELLAWIETLMPENLSDIKAPKNNSNSEILELFKWSDSIISKALVNPPSIEFQEDFKTPFIDRITLHPIGGLILFNLVMALLFSAVFWAAAPLMDLVDTAFSSLGEWIGPILGDNWFSSLIVDGLIAGGGAVFVFVPQIAILFLAMGILEDSGYLARGAMLVDRFLEMIGLNGKSFVPLLSGNACAIPAAMAARTIPGQRERILTLLIIPLMSCSARLPVWGLLLGFLIPPEKAWLGGIALTSIYVLSLVIASVVALIGGKLLKLEAAESGFQIEIPMWRRPNFKTILIATWDKTKSYLNRAGLVIMGVSVGFWIFMNYPSPDHSFGIMLGKFLQPFLMPMGLDWRVGVALIAAFAAREVFVAALAVVFTVEGGEEATEGIIEAMRHATFEGTDKAIFTTSTILGLIIFFIIALQCLTTVAVMRREVSDKFAFGQMFSFVFLAYILSIITVQGLRLLGVA